MEKDNIIRIEIDDSGRLHLKPEKTKFTLIYRTATEVHWDDKKLTLYSPMPRDWSYSDWYCHITEVEHLRNEKIEFNFLPNFNTYKL